MKSATLVLIMMAALVTTLACNLPDHTPPTQPSPVLTNPLTLQSVSTQRPETEMPPPPQPTVNTPQPTPAAATAEPTEAPPEPPPTSQFLPQPTSTSVPLPSPQQPGHTPKPEPTATEPAATMPAVEPAPTDIAAMSVYDKLSEAEKECLGPEIGSDQDLVDATSHMVADPSQSVSCLSEENLFWLYYIKAEPEAGLQEPTHRCIWSAFRRIDSLSDPDGSETDIETFAKVMSLMLLAPLYCVQTHEPNSVSGPDSDTDQEQIQSLACHVDEVGGIIEWVNLLFTDDGSYEETTALSEEKCGPIE